MPRPRSDRGCLFERRLSGDVMNPANKVRLELVPSDRAKPDTMTPAPFRQSDHEDAIAVIVSILAARRNGEPQSVQAEDTKALGRLIAELAHDFNNLFSVIIGNAELLTYATHAENRTPAEFILEAAERGADLTRRLRIIAGQQSSTAKPTDSDVATLT
jgi:nitrogen-specific signal transduction histidine kinase